MLLLPKLKISEYRCKWNIDLRDVIQDDSVGMRYWNTSIWNLKIVQFTQVRVDSRWADINPCSVRLNRPDCRGNGKI